MKAVSIRLENVSKTFIHRIKGKVSAVDQVSLQVEPGEFLTLLGPSGCGKTTTLRMIAGFERPDRGRIFIGDEDVTDLMANQRNIGFVFQNYALFPHLSVFENVAYGLRVKGMQRAEIEKAVNDVLALVGLKGYEHQFPHQLSGGEQQRVALARAVVIQPRVLLFDEPLSNLDAKLRVYMRSEIRRLQKTLSITTVYVTHDQEEALSLSDRIVVMRSGKIEQIGTPFEIYNQPANAFVASFIGTLNVLDARVVDPKLGLLLVEGQEVLACGPVPSGQVKLSLRPEMLSLESHPGDENHLAGTLSNIIFLGSIVRLVIGTGSKDIFLDTFNTPRLELPSVGAQVSIGFSREACLVME